VLANPLGALVIGTLISIICAGEPVGDGVMLALAVLTQVSGATISVVSAGKTVGQGHTAAIAAKANIKRA
jgi:hypothetical protein